MKTAHALGLYYAAALRRAARRAFTSPGEACPIVMVKEYLEDCGSKSKPPRDKAMKSRSKKKTSMTREEQQLALAGWVAEMKETAFKATCTKLWSRLMRSALVETRKIRNNVTSESIRHLVMRFQKWHRHNFVAIAASQREVAPAASPTVAADEPAPANILLVQYVTGRDNAGNICLSFMDLSTEIEIVGEETVEDALRRFFTVESNAAELANWQVMRVGHGTQDTFNPAAHKAKDVKAVLLRRRGG